MQHTIKSSMFLLNLADSLNFVNFQNNRKFVFNFSLKCRFQYYPELGYFINKTLRAGVLDLRLARVLGV